jgi:hypothetical protein
MFRNYFKTAWRNLIKNKAFSVINILGLTIGITVCMMIYLFILNEFSVHNFHKNGKAFIVRCAILSTMGNPAVWPIYQDLMHQLF